MRRAAAQPLQTRRQQVQDSIKSMEAKQKAKKRVPLRMQADSRRARRSRRARYYLLSLLAGVLAGAASSSSPARRSIVSLLVAFACGFGLPRWIVSRMTKRRQAKFLTSSPMPSTSSCAASSPVCRSPIACRSSPRRLPEPVAGEFIDLVEQQRVGVPLARAFERMMSACRCRR